MMNKTMPLIITVLAASALIASAFALLTIQRNIPGSGTIKSGDIGVYWDQQCTNRISSVDFGLLEAGSSKDFDLYLRNEGNTDVSLNMTSKNWIPTEAADFIDLTWNREGYQIGPDQVVSCLMTLSVSQEVQGINTFSLTITISATG